MKFFTNVELLGNKIVERFIDIDGKEKIHEEVYKPTLFLRTPAETKYKDIYGNFCTPKRFENIQEARKWMYQKKDTDEVLGMDNFVLSYLSDKYPKNIEYDMSKIRIAIFDIEVTTDGEFPKAEDADYPIDSISLYDMLDDKIYIFDLLEDKKLGVKKVEAWRPDTDILSHDIIDKVVYRTYTCSDQLLIDFVDYIRKNMPSILAGWNSDQFDIPYIMNRLKKRFGDEYAKRLSPYNEVYERKKYNSNGKPYKVYSPKGFSHLDYMEIYSSFRFKTQPSYSLDYIGKEETGKGKIDYIGPIHTLRRGNYLPTFKPEYDENDRLGKWLYIKYMVSNLLDTKRFNPRMIDSTLNVFLSSNRHILADNADKIIKLFDKIEESSEPINDEDSLNKIKQIKDVVYEIYSAESHRRYISYSIFDVVLVKEIDDALSFFELVFDLAYYAKIPIDSVTSKIQIWDAIIFNSLKRRNLVVPMKEIPEHNERIVGAFVKDPIVGIHRMVMSFDLTSLYPMIMLQTNISPEMLVGSFEVHPLADYINKIAPRPSDKYSCSPNGWMYKKDSMGIIPSEVLEVFSQRKQLKNEELKCKKNAEIIETMINRFEYDKSLNTISHKRVNGVSVDKDLDIELLKTFSRDELKLLELRCKATAKTKHTGQLNRKILINSAYGAMANKYFRYMDTRNASAITMFGQLVIQWAERKINEYMNKVLKTENVPYVFYIDTDSVYVDVEQLVKRVGIEKFKDTNSIIDFLDKFAVERVEPMLKDAFQELADYMNNMKSYMNMDREVIAMADINSEGLGAIWTGKKRYALNVYDNEGVRYATPQLKIMGIETQRSSTPKIVSKGLEESIRVMLQEGISSLQEYVDDYRNKFLLNYRELDYKMLASVSSANNLEKYGDENLMPIKGCPGHIKGALAYNRIVRDYDAGTPLREGMKIMILNLKDSNPFKSDKIAWESNENIPYELNFILEYVDYMSVLNKHFFPSLKRLTDAGGFSYESESLAGTDVFSSMFM